jgi:hypothetical protein
MTSSRTWRRSAAAVLAAILTATIAGPAAAHRAGQCVTDSTLDRCEQWTRIYNDATRTPPHRADEFTRGVAASATTVFTVATSVAMDIANPYEAAADWVLLAHDTKTGALRWEARRRSRHYDMPTSIAVSADGKKVYVAGAAYDGYPVGSATDSHMVTVAYDAVTGAELWSRTWDNRPDGTDNAKTIAVTRNGKTVVIGGVTTTASDGLDYVTVAYDAVKGRELWSRTHNGLRPEHSTDSLNGIAVSPDSEAVFVTGESAGAAEFDADYVTIAYDVRNGRVLWQQRFAGIGAGGSDRANAVAVAPDGSQVYVTGDSYGNKRAGATSSQYDYATVAYDARTGAQRWVARYGGPVAGFNAAIAIAASADRVVVTGQSRGATTDDVRDYGTVAYDAATGQEAWQQRYAPPKSDEVALDLALSPDGATTFVTGSSRPVVNYTALDEAATVAYSTTDGTQRWVSRLDVGTGNAVLGRQLAATPDGGVVMVGQVTYSADPLGPPSQNIYDAIISRY